MEGMRINGVKTAFNLLKIANLIYINGDKNPEVSGWPRLCFIQIFMLIVSSNCLQGNILVILKN